MSIMQDLLGTWGGILTVATIVVMGVGIPAAIAFVLYREIKGPAEKEHPQA
jgi:hypothetical protein